MVKPVIGDLDSEDNLGDVALGCEALGGAALARARNGEALGLMRNANAAEMRLNPEKDIF